MMNVAKELTVEQISQWLDVMSKRDIGRIDLIDEYLIDGMSLWEFKRFFGDYDDARIAQSSPTEMQSLVDGFLAANPAWVCLREKLIGIGEAVLHSKTANGG